MSHALPRSTPWIGAIIIFATFITYFPAWSAGFIWDDHLGHVTRPALPSVASLPRIWFEPGASQPYYPLLPTAFWIEQRL
ncbi:MAG: hypothetical protein RL077_3901 [Verrucomicrobiota bacterium]|jgi:hypothetical protein